MNDLNIWFILMIIGHVSNMPFNQPGFSPNATWNPNATTVANINTIGSYPLDIFINTNNTIYIPNRSKNQILVWSENNMTLKGNISISSSSSYGIFVTEEEDIYVGVSSSFYGINKYSSTSTNFTQMIYTCQPCFDVFVDIENYLYCSMTNYHQVVKKSVNAASNALTIVAGIAGSAGSTSTMLYSPYGIFVDDNFDLYVADSVNNRIQLFHSGETSATTVAGSGSATITISLLRPTGVILDADKYLFIVDQYNHRIIGSSANGFRCVVGCSGSSGSTSDKLLYPFSMAFDSYGNIYVSDQNNHRIQKFILSSNFYSKLNDDINITTVTEATASTISDVEILSTEATENTTETPTNVTSYNQPKFNALAYWNPDGITFATSTTIGTYPYGIFINTNNTIFVANQLNGRIQVWLNNSVNQTRTISGNLSYPYALFVTSNGDIYTGNSYSSYRVDKRQLNSNSSVTVMSINDDCFGLFVDIANNLYCSLRDFHQVVKKPINSTSNMLTIVAGVTCATSSSNGLNSPYGIYVDINFDLYVADCGNNRIQLFSPNQFNGKTVAGSSAVGTILLACPTGVVLDADNYLYIVDQSHHRIVGSGPNGFRCVVGCYGSGSASNLLYYPQTMAFDSYGNIYVTDRNNHRIQKFVLLNNTNASSYNTPKFCSSATWNPNGITIANVSIVGTYPRGIYIDKSNALYVASTQYRNIRIWFNDSLQFTKPISHILTNTFAVFVTSSGNIYVNKITLNSSSSTVVYTVSQICYGLFVDIIDNLYCSMASFNYVQKKPLTSSTSIWVTVAGTGSAGSTSTMLYSPYGIFVDVNFDLYVADCYNNRIQLFHSGETSATTVAGSGSATITISLLRPTGVILDADKYLFIVDEYNHRIIGSSANGFRCIIGCSGSSGSTSDKLLYPFSMAFDSYGDIYVTDQYNHRIQKFILSTESCSLSYNRPKFCSSASWYSNATTFASSSTIGSLPYGIFVSSINTVYAVSRSTNNIFVWPQGNNIATRIISGGLNSSYSIFVTVFGDIYVDNGLYKNQINKWTINSTNNTIIMNVNDICYGLFIDINDTIYCSLSNYHQVMKLSLNDSMNQTQIAAGNGIAGSSSDALNSPRGIFVNTNFDLYVADCNNNRIQLFESGQQNGTSLAINASLNCPTDIVLDGNDSLFIVDSGNHRIIVYNTNGSRCIVGCSSINGSLSTQLNYPQTMSFDSYGNIYVVDRNNNRIQKFLLNDNRCNVPVTIKYEQTSAMPTTTTTTKVQTMKCSTPIVSLIPNAPTLSSPIPFRRNQDFSIISLLQITCNGSLSVKNQWTIRNCTSTCLNSIQLDQTIVTTSNELYVPARTLPYGIYQLQLTITIISSGQLKISKSIYVQINPSGITANLIQLGTSMVTSGYENDLLLDPGTFSVDPDVNVFNSSLWRYKYYCRIYGLYQFPNIQGELLTIDDPRNDTINPSCLSNRTAAKYGNLIQSSMTIFGRSLPSNQTYQFMVQMENINNDRNQATGYLLVKIEDTRPQLIAIGCVISTMCVSNLEFQLVNPTTQVALFAQCIGNCTRIQNITWNVYSGSVNESTMDTMWTLFNQILTYENIWFFGTNTSNFTATNQLFLSNPEIQFWRFQVVYSFSTTTSSSALNFVINQPPVNGSCLISPSNGTTSTSFTILCSDWSDEDGIKDYSFYIWTIDRSKRTMIGFSSVSQIQLQLPAGDDQTSQLNIIAIIRDQLDCTTEYNLLSVFVQPDSQEINNLISSFQTSSSSIDIAKNPIIQMLTTGNQNTIGQVLTSISQEFNKMNSKSVDQAASNGVPIASISISSLGSQRSSPTTTQSNQSALNDFNKDLNSHASIREYLLSFTSQLSITTLNSIILQSSTLAQMTKATNQLTRLSLTNAADKCYQLSLALYSIAAKIAYEDAQTAATQLIQCGTNILSAVNGPLQQRTIVLDSDLSHASTLPDDYDTDLESDWSNPKLFVDGNDISPESIEKGWNAYYQKQTANQIDNQLTEMISLLTSILNIHLNIGQNSTMNTSEVYMSLETRLVQSLADREIKQVGDATIRLPTNFHMNISSNSTVSIRSIMKPLASFGNSKSSSNTNVSTSISLSILDQYENELSIETNSSQPIEVRIPRDSNFVLPSMILQNVIAKNDIQHQQFFQYHYVNISQLKSISIHLEIHPLNSNLSYLFIYKFDQIPQLNQSYSQIDGWTFLCSADLSNENIYTYFIDNEQTQNHQSLIFGLRELNSTESLSYCSMSSITTDPPKIHQRYDFTSNYELRTYTAGCYYLDKTNQWKSDGLRVGPLTNHQQTQCFSTHLTTFAGGFLVLPEPINWQYVFANANFLRNKTIYLTVICMSIIYLILLIFARYKDRKDLEKLGVTPLLDNHSSDKYYYQILVFTGQRKYAGTKSNVQFILAGDHDETHVRTLADPKREILQRGGIDAFIMSVSKSLGPLNYIRIWHDNSGLGTSSSWFLKYLIIRDLQTMEKSHFFAQRWFAVEKEDGKIERTLPVAGTLEKNQFSYVLSKKAYHSVSDGHLWFSIFSRPASNKFTRVQRCTCCFVLLFFSMFLNIMYYDLKKETQLNNSTNTIGLKLGPLLITPEQIGIGIIVDFLAFIPSILLVQIFRRLRSRQTSISPLRQCIYEMKPHLKLKEEMSTNQKKSLSFPWWFIFIAYGLCLILLSISILFIIARGIEFGDTKTQQWLVSSLTGVFSSICLTQPLKILTLAIIFTFLCRKSDDDKEAKQYFDENQFDFDDNNECLHSVARQSTKTNRLTVNEIELARNERLKELHMWSIVRETIVSIYFLCFIFLITYSNRTTDSFYQVDHLRKTFENSRQTNLNFLQISTINQYWNWLEESFIDNFRSQHWYNNNPPKYLSGYINDKSNRLIGWGTMRQIRIKSDLCSYEQLNLTCYYDYSSSNEETDSFELGWINITSKTGNTTLEQAFQYKTSDELDTYSYQGNYGRYSGGGYVYEFRGRLIDIQTNLSALHQLGWIDMQTRAILIQFNLYNPNVELFTSITLLTEFSPTGNLHSQSRIVPMNLYFSLTSIFQFVCLIFYMIFIVYSMFMEFKSILHLKLKYFYQFWSLIELGIIICSWMAMGIYICRSREYSRIGRLFHQTNGYVYINLQYSTYLNDYLTFIYGFCCFFGTIKMIRLCRFNSRLNLFIQTLENSFQELLSFLLMFSIVFISFVCLFYFIFQSKLFSCSTFLHTTATLFQMTLMKFDAYELIDAGAFLGPFCFSLFIFIVVFVCISMFLSIINANFKQARDNLKKNDENIYAFMFDRFLCWTGLRKPTRIELHDAMVDARYREPIEHFPEKIDELLDVLNRIYMTQVENRNSI